MYDYTYEDAINKLKEVYPQFKQVEFDIYDGELGYISGIWSLVEQINIGELQQFVNEFLGQKVYKAEYVAYRNVYARSEEEAREFARDTRPNPSLTKVYLTNLDRR